MKSPLRVALLLVAAAFPLLAADALALTQIVRFEPARPTATDRIRVTVSGVWTSGCVPKFMSFAQKDRVAILYFETRKDGLCPAITPPWSESVEIGPLAAGEWEITANIDGFQHASARVTVQPSAQTVVLVPSSSPADGGARVRLRGPGIGECPQPCTSLRVTFGGVDAGEVRTVSGSELEVTAPRHDAGRVDVMIFHATTGASITLPGAFRYFNTADGPPADAYELILIPLMFEGNGAFGSRWTTELAVHNGSDLGVDPWNPIVRCPADARCRPQIPPGTTLHLTPSSLLSWIHGYLFAVPREQADDLDFSLHIRDLSRQAESDGTEIPVVRESDLPRSPVTLLEVPVDGRSRRMLRIYDLAAVDGTPVVMRWRLDNGEQCGNDIHLTLRTVGRCIVGPCWLPEPAGIAMPLFEQPLPPNLTQDHLHVEIEPLMPHSRLWAFVTLTNNETQQVTTITP